jgi:hypothetical protein
MDWKTMVVEVLKAVAWPLTISGLAFWFRDSLRQIVSALLEQMPRLSKIGLGGVEMLPSQAQRQDVGATEDTAANLQAADAGGPMQKWLQPYYDAIEASAKEHGHTSADQKANYYARYAAIADAIVEFWRLYTFIWRSQLLFLHDVNANVHYPIDRARTFFKSAADNYPDFYRDMKFEEWIAYLFSADLISAKDGTYSITEKGQRFLEFVLRSRLSTDKPG